MSPDPSTFTAFVDGRRIAHGGLPEIVRAAHAARDLSIIVLDDLTGRTVDFDVRGDADDAVARVSPKMEPKPTRGRPKLGVTAREVTLLPRHWEWLATQPGGASAALRRLVDDARRTGGDAQAVRQAQEVAYRVMTTLAGDLANYEEATRALFANDVARLQFLTSEWPADIRDYVAMLTSKFST